MVATSVKDDKRSLNDNAKLKEQLACALELERKNGNAGRLEPLKESCHVYSKPDPQWAIRGLELISKGQVAALTMAGGQGTRLGSSKPKGCFEITPGCSLFRLQARRFLEFKFAIPWMIMTSPATHQDTIEHFEANDYFGLDKNSVWFFQQSTIPALDEQSGRVILDAQGNQVTSPDGNGAIFTSMLENNLFERLDAINVKYIHVFSVDNVLVKPADPVFIGFSDTFQLEIASKSVYRLPGEKAGVFGVRDNRIQVCEYTELDPKSDSDYLDANIANHVFTLSAMREAPKLHLPFHVARKSIKISDHESVPGIKLERFIFDAFPMFQEQAVLRVPRESEFAPLKNATGSDSPQSCLEALERNGLL